MSIIKKTNRIGPLVLMEGVVICLATHCFMLGETHLGLLTICAGLFFIAPTIINRVILRKKA